MISCPASDDAPKPSKAPKIHKARSPAPLPSSSQATATSSEAAPARGLSLGQFLDTRDVAIAKAKGTVAHLASDQLAARQRLIDLEARQAQASRSSEPAATKVQTARAMAGLLAARKRELALVAKDHEEACDTLNQLVRQKIVQDAGALAVCDNCCRNIFAAQLQDCRAGPRSEALLHCPICSVDPNLH